MNDFNLFLFPVLLGLGLNMSDKNMTILFSVVLGVFALALVGFMFHRCKHKIQYFHQPLHNTDDTGKDSHFITQLIQTIMSVIILLSKNENLIFSRYV